MNDVIITSQLADISIPYNSGGTLDVQGRDNLATLDFIQLYTIY